jgi:HSP20 family protein
MTPTRRPPSSGSANLLLLQQEINRLFERLAALEGAERRAAAEWVPSVDVYECEGKVWIVVEVPGLQPESLTVVYRDGELTVSGERRDRRPAGIVGFLCMERPHGRFARTIFLDLPLDIRLAEARLAGGLLVLSIPRLKDRRGRETMIRVEREESS